MDPFADESFLTANNRPPANGWARLGQALGGNSNTAFETGAIKGTQLQTLMFAARKARDAEVGRQAMAKQAFDAGDNELGNAFLQGGGSNLGQLGNYQLAHQKVGFNSDAMAIAQDPNASLDSLNRRMIVIGGKPVDLTKIEDHTVLNPMVSPGTQTLSTNEMGQALLGSTNALTNQRNAAAGANNALSDKRRGMPAGPLDEATMQGLMAQATEMSNMGGPGANQVASDAWLAQQFAAHGAQINGGSTPSAFANEKPTSLTDAQMKGMFGLLDNQGNVVSIDSDEYRRFLEFQRGHHIPNAQRAAQLFATDMSNVVGGVGALPSEAPVAPKKAPPLTRLVSNLTDAFSAASTSAGNAIGHVIEAPVTTPAAPRAPEPSLLDTFKNAVGLGGNSAAPSTVTGAAPKFIEGRTYTDAKGRKAKYQSGQWVPVQ